MPAAVELGERRRQRLGRHASLVLILAAAADAVMLLRDVDELEEEREGAHDRALALEPESGDRVAQRLARATLRAPRARAADALLVVEQRRPLLLHEHAPEQVAEQPDVGAKCGIGRHGSPAYCHAERSQTEDGSEPAAAQLTPSGKFARSGSASADSGVAPTKAARSGEDACTR